MFQLSLDLYHVENSSLKISTLLLKENCLMTQEGNNAILINIEFIPCIFFFDRGGYDAIVIFTRQSVVSLHSTYFQMKVIRIVSLDLVLLHELVMYMLYKKDKAM